MVKGAKRRGLAFLVVLVVVASVALALTRDWRSIGSPPPSLAASPNAMAVDAVSGDGVDTGRTVSGTRAPFGVGIVVTAASTAYQGYQYFLEWDPAILAYDGQTDLSPSGPHSLRGAHDYDQHRLCGLHRPERHHHLHGAGQHRQPSLRGGGHEPSPW